jgi:hypothetical protein
VSGIPASRAEVKNAWVSMTVFMFSYVRNLRTFFKGAAGKNAPQRGVKCLEIPAMM